MQEHMILANLSIDETKEHIAKLQESVGRPARGKLCAYLEAKVQAMEREVFTLKDLVLPELPAPGSIADLEQNDDRHKRRATKPEDAVMATTVTKAENMELVNRLTTACAEIRNQMRKKQASTEPLVLRNQRATKKVGKLRLARSLQARYKFSDERLGNVSISLSAREAVLAFA